MQKRHVDHGSDWEEDEETYAFEAYFDKKPIDEILDSFPTDRNPKSIQMKLRNHQWEQTNGQKGLSGGNKWVKTKWARMRIALIRVDDRELTRLREEYDSLKMELEDVRAQEKDLQRKIDTINYQIRRRQEMQENTVRLPN